MMQSQRYSPESFEAMLKVAVVAVRRGRRRWRRWRQVQLIVPPLCVGGVGHCEGVVGASAEAKGSQASQVAGRPRQAQLGPL